MKNWDVSHVEFAHVINTLGNVVSCHDLVRIFNKVRSQIDHCAVVILTNLKVLTRHGYVDTPQISSEFGPVQQFLIRGWRVHFNIKIGGEVFLRLGRSFNIIFV